MLNNKCLIFVFSLSSTDDSSLYNVENPIRSLSISDIRSDFNLAIFSERSSCDIYSFRYTFVLSLKYFFKILYILFICFWLTPLVLNKELSNTATNGNQFFLYGLFTLNPFTTVCK